MSSEQIYESEKGVRLFSGLDWRVAPDGNLNKGIRSLAKDREAKYFVTLAAREPEEIARGDKRIEVIRNSVGYFVPSLDVEKPPRKSHSLAAAFALMTRNVAAGTMLRAPMLTLPVPVDPGELPVGITLQGRPFGDATVLATGARLEGALAAA